MCAIDRLDELNNVQKRFEVQLAKKKKIGVENDEFKTLF